MAELLAACTSRKISLSIDKTTVFVIGAGASAEAGLPTGLELKEQVSRLLDIRFGFNRQKSGDYQIASALQLHVNDSEGRDGDFDSYLHEAWRIGDSMPLAISIDSFVDSQPGNPKIALCGKLAIVRSILEGERNSSLIIDEYKQNLGTEYGRLENTWYLPFFRLLTENREKSELEERFKSVVLIVFNYDRCLEYFLHHALRNYYRISGKEAASLLKHIRIHHPYGSVGLLPWHGASGSIEFGAEPDARQVLELSKKIKTFTEGTNPESSDIADIKSHICNSNKLVFIGFAFHELNMELITPFHCEGNRPSCYATTFGISDSDQEAVESQVKQLYKKDVQVRLANLRCGDFFNEYWRSLAF